MSKIRAYYSTAQTLRNLMSSAAFDLYISNDPDFWMSTHGNNDYALLLVNGDDRDHTKISNQAGFKTADFDDIRAGIATQTPPAIVTKAINNLPGLTLSDFSGASTVREVLTVIIRHLQPGHCALSFDNQPKASGTFTDDFSGGSTGDLLESRTGWALSRQGASTAKILNDELEFDQDGGESGFSVWTCTDQGSADQYIIVTENFVANANIFSAVRLVDDENFIGHVLSGTGAAGARLMTYIAGSLNDSRIRVQGGAGYSFKIECDGSTIQYFRDSGGGFSQMGSDQTITDHQTETSAGIVTNSSSAEKYTYFENGLVGAAASATLTGTAITGGVTESEIVDGGKTIIITLTGDTWVATVGDDNAITDALIDGITSAQSEATGWNNEVRDNMVYTDITREVDNVTLTIVLAEEAAYSITANETITDTIPATALTGASEIVATPNIIVTNESAGGNPWYYYAQQAA